MGAYVNPKFTTKENWLEMNGLRVQTAIPKTWDFSSDKLLVCLVNNGPFTGAGIAYSERELAEFLSPDERPRIWYMVSKEKLYGVSNLGVYLPLKESASA